MWIENGQLTRRRFAALAAVLAVSLAGCRRNSATDSRGGASRPSRAKQTETSRQTETRRQTDSRRAKPKPRAADDRTRQSQVQSP